MPVTSMDAFDVIKAFFADGRPDNVKTMTLRLAVNEAATVKVEYFPDIKEPETATKKYRLEEIEDDDIETVLR